MALGPVEATAGWIRKYMESGKMKQAWGFTGLAGGGILNVAFLEELDAIMTELPFGLFSEIKICGLIDLKKSLEALKQAVRMMVAPNK